MRCKNGTRKGRDGKCHKKRKILSSPRRRYLRGGDNGTDDNNNPFFVTLSFQNTGSIRVKYEIILRAGVDYRTRKIVGLIRNYQAQHNILFVDYMPPLLLPPPAHMLEIPLNFRPTETREFFLKFENLEQAQIYGEDLKNLIYDIVKEGDFEDIMEED